MTVTGYGLYTRPMSTDTGKSKEVGTNKEKYAIRGLAFFATLVVCVGVLARVCNLGFPAKAVFDEVYFPVFAANFLHGIQSFDVHPPLGKFMIAVGIALFGNTAIGWRVVPAAFGVGLIMVSALLGRELAKDKVAFLFAPILFSLDGLLVVYSRVGLMDGVLLCVVLLTFYGALRVGGRTLLICIALLLGIAVSIKWIGIGLLLPVLYVLWRKKKLGQFLWYLPLAVIVYGFSVLSGDWIAHDPHPWAALLEWHKQAFHYHLYLTATHPWSSQWWSWPLMLRPVLFFYEQDPLGRIQVITSLGNPIIWWSSTISVVWSTAYVLRLGLQKKKSVLDSPLMPLLIGYYTFFLPWIFIHRVLFIYHYMISYGFALLILTYWLTRLWKSQKTFVTVFLAIIFIVALFYLPLAIGSPLSQYWLQKHFVFTSWL